MRDNGVSSAPTVTYLRRGARRFVDWWLGELAAMVPRAIRRWWRGSRGIVLVAVHGGRAIFSRPSSTGLTEILATEVGDQHGPAMPNAILERLIRASGKDFQLLLLLPDDRVLTRTLTLPSALAENLRQTLGFELDRYTPFRADQAYFGYRTADPPVGSNGSLRVELAVAPRTVVDEARAKVAALGLNVAGAALAADFTGEAQDIRNLLPASSDASGRSARVTQRLAAAAVASLLLLALLAIPVWQKRSTAILLLEPLAQTKAAAREVDALRDRLTKLVAEHDLLPNKKWDSYSTVRIIEELTRLLPDDTYVMQFEFDGKTVQVVGETGSSSSMLETLEGSPLFKEVAFKSPLTKIQGTAYDRFVVAATLEGASRPSPEVAAMEGMATVVSGGALPAASGTEAAATP